MPHLLIAGATGSGKSVAINTIITSLVYRHTPKDLRFLMIDPKMVELSMYNAFRTCGTRSSPTITTPPRCSSGRCSRWSGATSCSSQRRAQHGRLQPQGRRKASRSECRRGPSSTLTRDQRGSRRYAAGAAAGRGLHGGVLPFIVMIIDELADLMMTVQGEVETPLAMLAQKARAIGIHLILATQRPSVNVITGLIKANFPSRIAFRVASKVDSRTILDQNGAEALLGNGDMLFLPPGKSEPMRLQGAFIATEETERLMDWFKDAAERSWPRGADRAGGGHPGGGAGAGGARGWRGDRAAGRGGPRHAVPRGRGGLHPAPGRIHLAAAAQAADRLRPRGADHRPAALCRDSGPAGRQQAARGVDRVSSAGRVLRLSDGAENDGPFVRRAFSFLSPVACLWRRYWNREIPKRTKARKLQLLCIRTCRATSHR